MKQFEYKILVTPWHHDDLAANLNALGMAGWKVISVDWNLGQIGQAWVMLMREMPQPSQETACPSAAPSMR